MSCSASADRLQELTGRPCTYLPPGVDGLRFSPWPQPPERLIDVMESVGWVQAKAARVLGLTPRQVGYALRKHEIPIKKF